MPQGADILCVQYQGNALCLWAIVNADEPVERCEIAIVGTGHPMPPDNQVIPKAIYIGTVQQPQMPFVWHVFELP